MRTITSRWLRGPDRVPWHAEIKTAAAHRGTPERPIERSGERDSGRSPGASLLCEDDATRQRLLDMEGHMRSARLAVFVMILAGVLILTPWIGFWPLLAIGPSFFGYWLTGRRMPASKRPEYWFMGAWAFSQATTGLAVALTGGPRSAFLPWLAIPAVTLSSRFQLRGLITGVIWTVVVMIAVTVGVNPAAVAARPERLVVPLVLLGGVVVLSTALMRSDVKHRAEAVVDPLTGLFNRQALAVRAQELIAQARVSGLPLAVLMGDLDDFKQVNDRHGHHVGDAVLCEVASTLRATLRTFDYIYRYGGEEFVILLPGTDEARALAAAERVREAISASRPASLPMTMSIGVSVGDGRQADFDDLLIAADRALYRAKAEGRNRSCLGRAYDGVKLDLPEGSIAAQAATVRVHRAGPEQASPARAFELARRSFVKGEALDMQHLADTLGVSLDTLLGWCGDRESLLGEVNAALACDLLLRAKAEHGGERGAARVLAVYDEFACATANFRPLQLLLQDEPQVALRILTSRRGHVHPAIVRELHALLCEEHEVGALAMPRSELANLSYAIVRLAEAFLYNDAVLATEPQIHRSTQIVGRLMV